jgi:hypothetical protein
MVCEIQAGSTILPVVTLQDVRVWIYRTRTTIGVELGAVGVREGARLRFRSIYGQAPQPRKFLFGYTLEKIGRSRVRVIKTSAVEEYGAIRSAR